MKNLKTFHIIELTIVTILLITAIMKTVIGVFLREPFIDVCFNCFFIVIYGLFMRYIISK